MVIRQYEAADESQWLRCRLLSFYDTSYCEDVLHKKPRYDHDVIDLVAEEEGMIVGFIEVECEERIGDACYLKGDLGGNIWNIGVLPEYRCKKIASKLLREAAHLAKKRGIKRFEAWTQEDEAANRWYKRKGFELKMAYLNVHASSQECYDNKLLSPEIGEIYGIRDLNFEVPISRKEEIISKYKKYNEVRLYEWVFD